MSTQIDIKSWFILTAKVNDPIPIEQFESKYLIIVLIAGSISSIRDFIIYALSNWNMYYKIQTYNFMEAGVHAILEFFMVILFYFTLAYLFKFLYNKDKHNNDIIKKDVFYLSQLSIMKDILTLIFIFVRSLSYAIFPNNTNFGFYEPIWVYWNLYSISAFLTVMYISRYAMEKLKPSFRDFNKMIVASFFISIIIYVLTWSIIWIIRLLISLPLGYEFFG